MFKVKRLDTKVFESFEILETLVYGSNENVRFSTMYRTGYLKQVNKEIFLKEISLFLETLVPTESINVVLGDFNIRLTI